MITLVDGNGNSLYEIDLYITPPRRHGYEGVFPSAWYDNYSANGLIYKSLGQGLPAIGTSPAISIVDLGTITIFLSKSTMQILRKHETYDVYLALEDPVNDDGRQLLIGRLPVFFGGGPAPSSISAGGLP